MIARAIRISSALALIIAIFAPFAVDRMAEWIMARTPSWMAVMLLENLGAWAKPFASTGGLALIGLSLFPVAIAVAAFTRTSRSFDPSRRQMPALMLGGVAIVAFDAWAREWTRRRSAVVPRDLFSFEPPSDVTPVENFYVMSKNTVDPSVDAQRWRLKITVNGRVARELDYATLMSLPQDRQYSTLRCISNTLDSNLMGTALWSGIPLNRIAERPPDATEVAFIGVDGHGDSLPIVYAFAPGVMLVTGMNGKTLERSHGFPLRLIAPRYYGFKNVKWLREIAFTDKPYIGTWPKMGWKKEAVVHTTSHVDRVETRGSGVMLAGTAFAGDRGISRVSVRVDNGVWQDASLEQPLSPFCRTRWSAKYPTSRAAVVESRSCDGQGNWQRATPKQMFPDGVAGPTRKSI